MSSLKDQWNEWELLLKISTIGNSTSDWMQVPRPPQILERFLLSGMGASELLTPQECLTQWHFLNILVLVPKIYLSMAQNYLRPKDGLTGWKQTTRNIAWLQMENCQVHLLNQYVQLSPQCLQLGGWSNRNSWRKKGGQGYSCQFAPNR